MKTRCERCNGSGETDTLSGRCACDTCCGHGWLGQDDPVDGQTHINIYSKGVTTLGRALSNFSDHGVTTLDGEFASLEGYWYWLGCTHARREELRYAVGWQAKALGRELRSPDWVREADFKLRIVNAMIAKLILHPSIRRELQGSTLPFRHYYVYGGKVVEPKEGAWIVETWEHLRRVVKVD